MYKMIRWALGIGACTVRYFATDVFRIIWCFIIDHSALKIKKSEHALATREHLPRVWHAYCNSRLTERARLRGIRRDDHVAEFVRGGVPGCGPFS